MAEGCKKGTLCFILLFVTPRSLLDLVLQPEAEHACWWSLNHWTAREVPKKGTLWMVHYSLYIIFTFWRVCDYLVLNIAQKNSGGNLKLDIRDFPGGPVASTLCFQYRVSDPGSIPGQGTRFHVPQLSSYAAAKSFIAATTDPIGCNKG